MEKTVYMPLISEGAERWRPVRAAQVDAELFEIVDKIPDNESWAFAPLSRVRCRNKTFADGSRGLVVVAYAIESNPHYRLFKEHQGQILRIVLADGEEAAIRVIHVDEEHEDFVYDLLSTNLGQKYRDMPKGVVSAAKFADLVSARLAEQ